MGSCCHASHDLFIKRVEWIEYSQLYFNSFNERVMRIDYFKIPARLVST